MLRLANIVTFMLTLLISAAHAQENRDRGAVFELVLLGEREVDLRRDYDTIDVSYAAEWYSSRSFRALQFYAGRNDIEMNRLRITYINGFSEDVRVDRTIPRNGQLQVDLDGGRSYIRRIEMFYRARSESGGQALIRVYGEPARVAGPGGPQYPSDPNEWVRLGCHDAKFFNFFAPEQYSVTQPGLYQTIRIRVRKQRVEIFNVSVIFRNGASEDVITSPRTFQVGQSAEVRLRALEHDVVRIEVRAHTILDHGLPSAGGRIQLGDVCASGQPLRR